MTLHIEDQHFTAPAALATLEGVAAILTEHGFDVELLDDMTDARARVRELIPVGASVFTSASETLRLSGIEADINDGDRYDPIKPRIVAMDRQTEMDGIRRLMSTPDFVVGSVHAVTQDGSLLIASASGSQLPGMAGGAAHAIWVVGAQKVVRDLSAGLRRVEEHCLPLETARAQRAYGHPSAITRLLILKREPYVGRSTVLLLREAVGF